MVDPPAGVSLGADLPCNASAGCSQTTAITISVNPVLLPQAVVTPGYRMGVNYGCNRVRLMSPVPVGAKLRLGVKLLSVDDIADLERIGIGEIKERETLVAGFDAQDCQIRARILEHQRGLEFALVGDRVG